MAFIRVVEDFTCAHCGAQVQGSGYTNHCPKCLWSMHVDNDPGDRAALCGGEMRPMRLEGSTSRYRIVHRCERCSIERIVDVAENDDPAAIVNLSGRGDIA